MRELNYFTSDLHSCGYLPRQDAVTKFVHPPSALDNDLYNDLAAKGFRRTGELVYTPACVHCAQCVPVRLNVSEFEPSKRHVRTKKRNTDIHVTEEPGIFSNEHFELYQSYVEARHPGSTMAKLTRKQYMHFLTASWSDTIFIEFRCAKRLLAVAVSDRLKTGMSSVYTFYCPAASQRSLGNFAVLEQIDLVKKLNLQWLYLGYWIRDCKKMSYKNNFFPLQYFKHGRWGYSC